MVTQNHERKAARPNLRQACLSAYEDLRDQLADDVHKRRRLKRRIGTALRREARRKFNLFRGETLWPGQSREMTGRQAKNLNRDLEAKFLDGKSDKLWSWRDADPSHTKAAVYWLFNHVECGPATSENFVAVLNEAMLKFFGHTLD